MPKASGKEVLAEMKRINPAVRVLISSGYSDKEDSQEMMRLGAKGFIGKPFKMSELRTAIAKVAADNP